MQIIKFIFFFTLLLLTSSSSAQSLNFRQGEILIQLEDDLVSSRVNLPSSFKSEPLSYQNVVGKPFNIYKVAFDFRTVSHEDLIDLFYSRNDILHAQNNHLIAYRKMPDDPRFAQQWQYINPDNGAADLDIELAWDITTGGVTANGDTIVACIIDTGLDGTHTDFGDNVWSNRQEIPDNNLDDDLNGYVDDIHGWNTYNDSPNIFTGGSHGTAVTGIIGAKGNNGIGVSGINWDVDLMIVVGGGDEANALASYAYPYFMRKRYNETNGAEGAFVVTTNASWGTDFGKPEDAPIWCNFYDSLGVVGILNCGATINGNVNVDVDGDLPTACSSEFLISVTNLNSLAEKVAGAGYGEESIDLGAFGAETYTTDSGNSYGGFGGTSGATPHVAGTIALLYAINCNDIADLALENPAEAARLMRQYIEIGVVPTETLEGITSTGGRLNTNNSLLLAVDDCGPCKTPRNIIFNSNLMSTEIIFETNSEATITAVNLRYREKGQNEWTEFLNVSSPATLNDLKACTDYELQLKSICDIISSNYVFTQSFTTEGCCPSLIQERVDYNQQDQSITYFWESEDDNADFVVEYKKKSGNEWKIINTAANEFTLTDIEKCTAYEFRAIAQCQYDTTSFVESLIISTSCDACSEMTYCDRGSDNEEEWIGYVELGSIKNTSVGEPGGYGDYIGQHSTSLKRGETYNLIVGPGFEVGSFDEYHAAWIDYDQNGDFEQTDSIANISEATSGFSVNEFTVPSDAKLGYTRLRVILSFREDPDPCQSGFSNFGEIEDYCVFIEGEVGTKDVEKESLSIFPNPTTDHLIISTSNEMIKAYNLFDVTGALISKQSMLKTKQLNLDLSNHVSGCYLIQLQLEDGRMISKKILKI